MAISNSSKEDVSCEKAINKSRMEIILDGLRLLDEGKIEKIGPRYSSQNLARNLKPHPANSL